MKKIIASFSRSAAPFGATNSATLVLELLDGKTGEVLARIAERRAFGNPGGGDVMMMSPTNAVTVWSDVRRWASNAARRLRMELDFALEG